MTTASGEIATLGGGCFWCLEAVFERLIGVDRVVSGYAGGTAPDATYDAVCSGRTGHAEVVQVHFDPDAITFGDLLEVFFAIHDPTTLNRQGADVGTQYRSVVFAHSDVQERTTRDAIAALEADDVFPDPIVTEVVPFTAFYPAEAYHQGYYRANPAQGYCQVVVAPKLAKARERFAARLRP
jgi:peptide-methionine (S)-S-oxide reductase